MNIASSLLSGHLYFYKKDNHEGMQLAEYSSDLGSPEKGWSKCFIYCSTACVNVNCASKFHTLRHRIVIAYIQFFCAHSRKKCATQVPLLFIAISFVCITLLCKAKKF